MEGTGIEGRYLGLPDEFCNAETSKAVLLSVPFDKTTTYQKGSDKGPEAIIEASRNMEAYDIETGCEVFHVGIHTASPIVAEESQRMLAELYQATKAVIAKGQFVVTMGGEHSISQAPIQACVEAYPGLSVLQLDAHSDLQPAYEGDPYSHASVMSRVKEIPNIGTVVAAGIRSMSVEELPYIDRPNTFFAHDIHDNDTWIDRVIDKLSDKVYITLDLDVLDPAFLPATGTPEPGGLGWYQLLRLLRAVITKRQVVACDIVELCPQPHDKSSDFLAAKLIYKLLSYRFASQLKGDTP